MIAETISAAFLVGLLGSTHCFGMCGGIVGALSAGLADEIGQSRVRAAWIHVTYNAGRISSYTAAGLLFGFLGAWLGGAEVLQGMPVGRIIGAVVMILLGIYLTGWWHSLRWLEQAGAKLWQYIEPLGRRFIPVRSVPQAYLLGLVWGWLPCGMVYSVLALAFAAGSAGDGALVMLAFGLGTLPALLAMGIAFTTLGRLVQQPWVRVAAGLMVIAMGVALLLANPGGHGHHAHPHGH